MPVLKEYVDSNKSKDGYYVHSSVSGRNHPIPLQTPKVTERIYRRIGYKPKKKGPDGGVPVPKDLTWTLYNVGLHWTEKSGPQGNPSDLDPNDLRDAAELDLTENDIETILKFTEDYRGQYQSRVKNLQEKFTDKLGKVSSENPPFTFMEQMKEYSNESHFDDEVEELLNDWEPDYVKDDDYDPDEDDGLLSQCIPTRSEYWEALSLVPDLKTRLREYESHPWDVKKVGAAGGSTGNNNPLSVSFRPDANSELKRWSIWDHRGVRDKLDFAISAGISGRRYSFNIKERFISDFDMTVTYMHEPVGKFDIPEDFWVYEEGEQTPNKMMHTLIVDFHHLIQIIEEFFDGIASFELESMHPTDYSMLNH